MKSIAISSYTCDGMGSGCNNPAGREVVVLAL